MAARPAPSISEAESAFAQAMQEAGFLPGAIRADTDNFVRFDAPGDKPGKGNGFYKLKTGQYPVGWFGDWKTGEQHQWFFHDPGAGELSEAERKRIKREQARLKAEAAQARELKQAEIAEEASRMWGKADGNVEGHPYLERKRITIPRGLRAYQARDGTRLLAVPMWAFDLNGQPRLLNLQMIDGEGRKTFLKAGRVEGTFFSIKGDGAIIVVCEGVATAFSIWEATGLSVVAAFHGGNLIEVAREFARWRQLATLLIAGDDDVFAPDDWGEKAAGRPWKNVGALKAEAAAKAVGCRFLLPVFAEGPDRARTDFNDLHLAEGLAAVKAQVLGAFDTVEPQDAAPGAKIVDIDKVQDESWRSKVPKTSQGSPDGANVDGVALYVANHRHLAGRLRFNQLSKEMEIDGNPLEDYHVAEFRRIMHAERFKAKKSDVQDEMAAEARRNQYDPLVEYLQALQWDRKPRLDAWLATHMGAADTTYTRTVGRKFLIGAVARASDPGCKMDNMLVAEGEQNIGKSTAFRYLFGDRFFTDHLPDFHSKDSFQQLEGAWCVEVAELAALTKAEVKDVKQFLSRLVDKYRVPYARHPILVPRRTVFVGTVNPEYGGYLRDPTGARRFWPFEATTIDLPAILRDRDALWAEAVMAYRGGESWYLDDEDSIALAKEEQALRRERHPWEDVIEGWARREVIRQATCAQVLGEALKIPADKLIPKHAREVGACMRALGWKPETQRVDGKVAKVFKHPELVAAELMPLHRRPIPGAIGPQDDVPFD